jgi:3-oxoacyl-[acyl-carrier-protein] synthase-3
MGGRRIGIVGTGSYLPDRVLSNSDLEKILDTSDEWIYQRTGVRERRIADSDVNTSDLARKASLRAMEMAGMSAKELELIILATITPDTCCPAGANWLEAKLGAHKAVSFDITAACCGFVFGLSVAEQYLKTGAVNNALVVASEVMSRCQDWTDRENCILWGDGAGAVVLQPFDKTDDGSPPSGPKKGIGEILSTHIHSDGKNGENLLMPGGGSRTTPIGYESVDKKLHTLKMIKANESVRVAVKRFAEAAEEAASANGIKVSEAKWIIPHQANIRILQQMAKRLNIPMEKVYLTIEKYGNISSSTIPIALDEAVRNGSIQKGDYIILTGFGGGLTWASSLIKW